MEWKLFTDRLSAPARRALEAAGIGGFDDLAARSEADLLALHGLGPASLGSIRAALAEERLALRGETPPGSTAAPGPEAGDSGVDAFIAAYPPATRELLETMRRVVRENAPGAGEKIAYGIPTFTLNGNLVHFSAYGRHIGFYPGPEGIEAFREELSSYESAKGSIRFPLDRPVPFDLVARIVRFRVEQNLAKKRRR